MGEWRGRMESGLRARASEARAIQARWRVGKSKRKVTSKNSILHHHHPNFYNFFPRAIAPFTGTQLFNRHCNQAVYVVTLVSCCWARVEMQIR